MPSDIDVITFQVVKFLFYFYHMYGILMMTYLGHHWFHDNGLVLVACKLTKHVAIGATQLAQCM